MKQAATSFDIIVVGGGHAGVEAALISAKLGLRIALVTPDIKALARMSCNPAIGGLAKGQMVREIDVLGGVMAEISDRAGIQFKMLNRSKGRSVWSPRAQVDKRIYESRMLARIMSFKNLCVYKGEVVDIVVDHYTVRGAVLRDGSTLRAQTIILTCGTFLNGLIHIGKRKVPAGRMGESNSQGVTEALVGFGLKAGRLKTGTPPRLVKKTVDWSKAKALIGDTDPTPFSYKTKHFNPPNIPCHQVKTTPGCHEVIRENIHRSPMYSGDIFGIGPRYCPSIEDKIHRFAHHSSHLLFLEPEWLGSDQIYTNGFSTSLPEEVQLAALRQIPGLEQVELFRPGYAIEYDFFAPAQHRATLESKTLSGLFFAGQINGTSGYEEAAAQGLIAGVNAAMHIFNRKPLTLARDEAYIGVLIDDLITKDTAEPYRMFTSRAEYRLLLRYSNADHRLVQKAKKYNLINKQYYDQLVTKLERTTQLIKALDGAVTPEDINLSLIQHNESPINQKRTAKQLLKRPGISIQYLPNHLFTSIDRNGFEPFMADEIFSEAETIVKYEGYIERQLAMIKKMKAQEKFKLPANLDYSIISSLSIEAREKLQFIKPETLGQAMRISGVSPADISVLSVLISKRL